MSRSLACACVTLLVAAGSALAQLPNPTLTNISPPGAKQGTNVEVKVTGGDLDDLEKLVFSHPGITAEAKMTPPGEIIKTPKRVFGEFTIKVAGDVPPGVYEVRAAGRYGMSGPRSFAVGTGNEVAKTGDLGDPAKAMELPVGSVVSGSAEANKIDYYKIPVKAGQRLILECLAERIDSRMDATLVLLDAKNREIRRSRDVEGRDPALDYTAKADGTLTVGVFDFTYAGGTDYPYRLSVTSGPRVDFIFPPAGVAGTGGKFTLYGRNLPGGQPVPGMTIDGSPLEKLAVDINVPSADQIRSQPFSSARSPQLAAMEGFDYQHPTPQGPANPVRIYLASGPVVAETEPNNEPAQANKVTVPCDFVGQFYPSADADWLTFDAKKGDEYWLEVVSHRLGIDCDPALVVVKVTKNDKGEEVITQVAEADDPADRTNRIGTAFDVSTDDPSLKFKADDDATYRVLIRDNFGDGTPDPRRVYRLSIRKPTPDFSLVVYGDEPKKADQNQQNKMDCYANVIRKGGSELFTVVAFRRDGFEGEIEVSVEGLPAGVVCPGAVLGGNVDTASLLITASEGAAAWSGPIKIVGKAKVAGADAMRPARGMAMIWGTANIQQQKPVVRLVNQINLSICDSETAVASIEVGEMGKVYETAKGGKLEIPVKVARRNGFGEALKLVAVGLPQEVKPKEVNITGGDGKFELDLGTLKTAGSYTLYLSSPAKLKYAKGEAMVKKLEEEKKEMDAAAVEATKKVKEATDAKATATKAVLDAESAQKAAAKAKTDADAELKAAKDEDKPKVQEKLTAAEKALAEADAKLKAATEAKAPLEAAEKAATDMAKKIDDMKKAFDKTVDDAKKAAAPKDITISLLSTGVKLRVYDAPIKATTPETAGPAKQGEKITLPVSFEKMFEFDDAVDVTLEPAAGVTGITAAKLQIAKGQNTGNLEITLADAATAGDVAATIKLKGKFNTAAFELAKPITLKVEKK